jgi:hypothetical protein
MVFRENPQIGDDVPPDMKAHLEDIDLKGTHFDVFAKGIFGDATCANYGRPGGDTGG